MTVSNALDLNAATKLVSDFHNTLTDYNTAHRKEGTEFSANKRDKLYQMLASAYGVSLALIGDAKVLGQLCSRRGVQAPGTGENPHSAPVRLLFRKKVRGENRTEADRSAWKYTKTFRAAQAMGWTSDNFIEKLSAFEHTISKDGKDKKLKGLIALETWDTQEHGNPEAEYNRHEVLAAQQWMATRQPLGSFPAELTEDIPASNEFAMLNLAVQWNPSTQMWDIRGVVTDNAERAWNTVAKDVVAGFRTYMDEQRRIIADAQVDQEAPHDEAALMAALAAHNRDLQAREVAHGFSQRLAALPQQVQFSETQQDAA